MTDKNFSYNIKAILTNKKNRIAVIVSVVIFLVAIIACGIIFGVMIPQGKEIKSITVNTYPTKLQYYVGDKVNLSGLKLSVLKNNGDTYYVDGSECEISGFDSSKPADSQFVTVKYQGFTTGFYVKINKLPTLSPTLSSIEITTMPKTEYKVGDFLDTTGGVITLHYADGSTYRVTLLNKFVYGFNSSTPGEYDLTVKYTKDGILCETTYTITVSE